MDRVSHGDDFDIFDLTDNFKPLTSPLNLPTLYMNLKNLFQMAAGFVDFIIVENHADAVKEKQKAEKKGKRNRAAACFRWKKKAKGHECPKRDKQGHKADDKIAQTHGDLNAAGVQVVVDLADDDGQEVVAVMDDTIDVEFAVFQRAGKEFMIARQPPTQFAWLHMRRQMLLSFVRR